MKIALLNDTHCGVRNNNQMFAEYQGRFYREVFFPYLDEHNIKHIIHLGDYFDRRRDVNFYSLHKNYEHFIEPMRERGITMDLIVGNHDIYFKSTNELNSPDYLLNFDNVNVYKDPITKNYDGLDIALLPWINSENEEECHEFLQLSNAPFVMSHLEVNGGMMSPGHYHGGGTPQSWFERFEQVFSGHFHHKSTLGNIRYLGSQMEFTWNDFGDDKYFHVFDTETREIEMVKNPLKMFHKVFYDDTNETLMTIKKKNFSHLENTFVKVIVTNKNEPYWFDVFVEELIKANPADLKVVEDHSNLDVLNEDELVGDAEDTLTILTKHIDSLNIDGDKTKLDTLMRSLYTESLDILV
tara:strand:+ start:4742 stop:5803 length:1062 start_codon:yes stop_codon:yes gene_type:complete